MRKTISISFLFIVFVLTGCKTKQPSSNNSLSKNTTSSVFTKTLTVEFYSKGGGINHTAFSTMKTLLQKQIEGVSCEFENNLVKYGREGERQYCMTFNDEKCYSAMYSLIKEKIGGQEDIRIEENGTCHNNTR